jgi:hypothetical protein
MPLRFGMQHPTWMEMLKNDRYDISDVLDYLQPYRTGDK